MKLLAIILTGIGHTGMAIGAGNFLFLNALMFGVQKSFW